MTARLFTLEGAGERFRKDTADHTLTIRHDDGLYRHLVVRHPNGSFYWFEVITWPGALALRGDMGSVTFARDTDMFEFFGSTGSIDPNYWAEKITHGGRDSVKEHSPEKVKQWVDEQVKDHLEWVSWPRAVARDLRTQADTLKSQLEGYAEPDYATLLDFRFVREHAPGETYTYRLPMDDAYPSDFRAYTHHFLWNCHAIRDAIARYRAHKAENAA